MDEVVDLSLSDMTMWLAFKQMSTTPENRNTLEAIRRMLLEQDAQIKALTNG